MLGERKPWQPMAVDGRSGLGAGGSCHRGARRSTDQSATEGRLPPSVAAPAGRWLTMPSQ